MINNDIKYELVTKVIHVDDLESDPRSVGVNTCFTMTNKKPFLPMTIVGHEATGLETYPNNPTWADKLNPDHIAPTTNLSFNLPNNAMSNCAKNSVGGLGIIGDIQLNRGLFVQDRCVIDLGIDNDHQYKCFTVYVIELAK